jgi:hypothetical protein
LKNNSGQIDAVRININGGNNAPKGKMHELNAVKQSEDFIKILIQSMLDSTR